MGNYIAFTFGRKGTGKSLDEARNGWQEMYRYRKAEKINLPKRIYFSKQKFSKYVEDQELIGVKGSLGHLAYWNVISDLKYCPRPRLLGDCWRGLGQHHLHDIDIAWDEIGNDLPPDGWKDNPPWLRQLFSHARKRRNRIFANAQRYDMVDIHFRRQVDIVHEVKRFFGTGDHPLKHTPKHPWLIQLKFDIEPDDIKKDDVDSAEATGHWGLKIPHFQFFGKFSMHLFDTAFELPPYEAHRMREIILECQEGDNCKDPKHRFQIKHVIEG